MRSTFASDHSKELLPFSYFAHKTILLRKLSNVEMWLQYNKIKNLRIAVGRIDGIILRPGEVFSYWKLIGKPSKKRGYVDGMILQNGHFRPGVGGGLCQLSNLIFWITAHTPLTVIERHRHSYDVFPDADRTQPFGSGATCFYPHGDLMIANNTSHDYQLMLKVGSEYLEGEWRVSHQPEVRIEVVEKDHMIVGAYWGGYIRKNELIQRTYDLEEQLLEEKLLVRNAGIMMYSPLLEGEIKPIMDVEK